MLFFRSIFFAFILLLTVNTSTAQSNQVLRKQALQAELNKDWYAAAQYYQRLCERDTTNLGWLYSYADASQKIFDLDIALRSFMKLASKDNGRRYPMSYYYIAQLQKTKVQYKLAQLWFIKFSKLKVNDRRSARYNIPYYKLRAKLEQEACEDALINMKYPVMPLPDHLDKVINTNQSEYAPFERDSVLYFSTLRVNERKARDEEEARIEAARPVYSKVFRADIRMQKFKKIKAIDTTINSNIYHAANTTFTEDGKLMIFSRCTPLNASENCCELYQSAFSRSRWLPANRLEDAVNQPSFSTTQPYLAIVDDKTILFFASDRPGGEGGLDIWYCYRLNNGSFTEPINAGKLINTPEDEVSPWYDSKNNQLFFSSPYHSGYGGFDIFKSEFKNNQFAAPVNAGYPINSSHNDLYYSQNTGGNHIYLSSNRTGSFFDGKVNCCSDIYRFTVDTAVPRPVKIDSNNIVIEKIRLLVPLTLYFHNDEPEPRTTLTITSKSYDSTYVSYARMLPQYLAEYSAGLKGTEKLNATDLIQNFFTDSVEAGLDQLNKFSRLLTKVLANGETVKITMKGYCSPLASTNYNINLAKRRISSLRNYFKEFEGGVFLKYIDNQEQGMGKIIFEDVQIGELPASKVSDNFKDKRNAVYSPYAAGERKIQIIAVSFGKE